MMARALMDARVYRVWGAPGTAPDLVVAATMSQAILAWREINGGASYTDEPSRVEVFDDVADVIIEQLGIEAIVPPKMQVAF